MNKLMITSIIFALTGSAYAANPLDDEVDPSYYNGYNDAITSNVQTRDAFPHASLGYDEELSEFLIPGHTPHNTVAGDVLNSSPMVGDSSAGSIDWFLDAER